MFLTIVSSLFFLVAIVAAVIVVFFLIASLLSMDGSKRNLFAVFIFVSIGFVLLHNTGAFAYPLA